MDEPSSGFGYLEHTADVGIRSWGPSLRAAFEEAAAGVATLMGAATDPPGRRRSIRVEGADLGGLLVALLNEVIYLCESADGDGLASLRVTDLTRARLEAVVELAPIRRPSEGLAVKAATYHQLEVRELPDGSAETRVYLDA
jgi:SHS2 domain-containing protein